jgi:hypothetical protein
MVARSATPRGVSEANEDIWPSVRERVEDFPVVSTVVATRSPTEPGADAANQPLKTAAMGGLYRRPAADRTLGGSSCVEPTAVGTLEFVIAVVPARLLDVVAAS